MKSEAYDNDEDDDEGLMVLLKFTYTDKYPEEKPLLEFEETDNIDDDVLEEFRVYLDEQVSFNHINYRTCHYECQCNRSRE